MSDSYKTKISETQEMGQVGPNEVQTKLMIRMDELRARNTELHKFEQLAWEKDVEIFRLRAVEEELKQRLDGLREAHELGHERRDLYQKEIATLKVQIEKNDTYLQQVNDEYNRKLARISDKSWEKELEIKSLQSAQAALESEVAMLHQLKSDNERRIAESVNQVEQLKAELKQAAAEIRSLEDRARYDAKNASEQVLHVSREREDYVRRIERELSELQGQLKILNVERIDVNSSIRNRNDSMSEMANQIEHLKASLREVQTSHAVELQAVFSENRVFIERLKEKHADVVSKMKFDFDSQKLKIESDGAAAAKEMSSQFEEQIHNLSQKHELEIEALEQIERDLTSEATRLRIESAGQTKHIESLTQSIRELKVALQEEKLKTARQEEAITNAITKNSELIGQIASLHEQLSMKEADLSKLKESLSAAVAQHEALKATFAELERTHKERNRETSLVHQNALKEEKLKRQAEAIEWSQRMNEFQTASAKELAVLKGERNDFALQLNTLKANFEARFESERSAHEARLQTERTAMNLEVSELETKIESLLAENAKLRISLAARSSNVEAEQRDFEIRSQHREKQIAVREKQVNIREMQLRQYASSVTDQKTELIRQTKVLAEEIQMAAKMHPLKDYLQLTDFELSRAEVQLKLTPTISSDRARLESHVKQMVEQRDFLRKIVQESETKFADQANTILELIRSPKLAATPPPPPRFIPKVESSPTVAAEIAPVDSLGLDN